MTKELLEKMKEIESKAGKGWLKAFEDLETSQEVIEKAAEYNVTLSKELGEESLKLLNSDNFEELSEEELSTVAGGKIIVPK